MLVLSLASFFPSTRRPETQAAVAQIENNFVASLFSSSSRESLEEEFRRHSDLTESLLGRRVFARNDALVDKENEGKGKWCRGYVESADFSSRHVSGYSDAFIRVWKQLTPFQAVRNFPFFLFPVFLFSFSRFLPVCELEMKFSSPTRCPFVLSTPALSSARFR